jgi:VWFA-related protein
MYDAAAEAVQYAESGQQRKKAIVIISDGNDTSSRTKPAELHRFIRESEVLVYAIGIDGEDDSAPMRTQPPPSFPPTRQPPRLPIPLPFPPRRPGNRPGFELTSALAQGVYRPRASASQRVNVTALRDITDDSGGRTEIIRDARDLDSATANIADELSRQYYLGYAANGQKDGRWHSIRVEVRNGAYRVRARRGYLAS